MQLAELGDSVLPPRFWNKVQPNPDTGCWEWTGSKNKRAPYGRFLWQGKVELAHRLAYEMLIGPIPEGLVIDHCCRHHSCVNPAHLDIVTQRDNVLRGETFGAKAQRTGYCSHGHELTPENLYTYEGRSWCRQCKIEHATNSQKTEEGRAWRRAYNHREDRREYHREYMRRYRARRLAQ